MTEQDLQTDDPVAVGIVYDKLTYDSSHIFIFSFPIVFYIYFYSKTTTMVKRIGGSRRKTRYKYKKEKRNKGKISFTRYLQSFNPGDNVHLGLESAVQKGIYCHRFMGKSGIVKGKRGKCYEVAINDMGKEKTLIVHPVHLRKA